MSQYNCSKIIKSQRVKDDRARNRAIMQQIHDTLGTMIKRADVAQEYLKR